MYHTVLFVLFLASPPFLPNLTASLLFFLVLIAYSINVIHLIFPQAHLKDPVILPPIFAMPKPSQIPGKERSPGNPALRG